MLKDRKKILFIIDSLFQGGAETVLLTVCKGLLSQSPDYNLHVIAYKPHHDLKSRFEEIGVKVYSPDLGRHIFFVRLVILYLLVKKIKPDIVHTHLLFADRYGLAAAFMAGVKFRLCTVHNMQTKRSWQDKTTRLLTSIFATTIIAVSDSVREYCIQNRMYARHKMRTIYNGTNINPAEYSPKRHSGMHKPLKIITIGRLSRQKSQETAIEASAELINSHHLECVLDIYGDGILKEYLSGKIKLLDLEDSVFLKGAVPGCELYLKLEKADIYIATSVYEGLSIAAIEAMSVGLPVIFSDIPAHRELVNSKDYVYPFLFPVGDKSDLAKKIIKLTANPDLYDAAAKWCHNQSFMFTGDKMADNYYKLYSE